MSESGARKVEELNEQAAARRLERDHLNTEAKIWLEKRDALNERVKKLRSEARNLKEQRDIANKKVQELKTLREQTKSEQKEKRAQISKTKERMLGLSEKKPLRDLGDIQEQIERIEWAIQTNPLTIKEEKTLVDQVRILENQRVIYRQIQETKDTLLMLQTEEKALATKARSTHEKLAELAEQSQKFHRQRLDLINEAQNLRVDADSAHQKHVELRQKAHEIHLKYMELLEQTKMLRQEMQKKDQEQLAKRQQELKEETTKKAQEKMKRGEKLTWEEFQLLAEQGSL